MLILLEHHRHQYFQRKAEQKIESVINEYEKSVPIHVLDRKINQAESFLIKYQYLSIIKLKF